MRTLTLALLFCLASAGFFSAQAQVFQSGQGHLCSRSGPDELLAAVAQSDFREVEVATSFSAKHQMVYHWTANRETGTWSVIRETSTGLSCLTDSGTAWVRDGDSVIAILDPNSALFKITTNGEDWLVSVQMTPEAPMQIGVDGGSQWVWVVVPEPAGFGI